MKLILFGCFFASVEKELNDPFFMWGLLASFFQMYIYDRYITIISFHFLNYSDVVLGFGENSREGRKKETNRYF